MLSLPSGWTEAIPYQLLADGVAFPLTGYTVALIVYEGTRLVSMGGSLAVTSAVDGKVTYTPGVNDFALNATTAYSVRFKLTSGSGKVSYFPRDEPESWIIRKP